MDLSQHEVATDEAPVEETAVDAPVAAVEPHEDAESEVEAGTGQPRLILKRAGQETEESFPFTAPAVIGRFDASVGPVDIDLGDLPEGSYVSRKHAKITCEDGVYRIEDLGSSNGTYVLREDFERVTESEIEDGTEIAFGNARFVVRLN